MAASTKQQSSDAAVSLALLVTAGTLLLASTGSRPGRHLLERAASWLNDQLLRAGREMAILEQEFDHRSMRER